MPKLSLTPAEVAEVRAQLGAHLTTSDLSDATIGLESTVGAATDYVLEKVREDMELEKIDSVSERTIATRTHDSSDDNLSGFLSSVLKPPQPAQFRRAVVYRTAGLCAPLLSPVLSESVGGISIRRQVKVWETMQAQLFLRCDEEIARLRGAFEDDAFVVPRVPDAETDMEETERTFHNENWKLFGIIKR